MNFGDEIIKAVRTIPLGTGVRSVWYLPDGSALHVIEDDPIEPGTYFMRPDDTGKDKIWVVEEKLYTDRATPSRGSGAPMRFNIKIHVGNTMRETQGGMCPGLATIPEGVSNSAAAIDFLCGLLDRDHADPPIWVLQILE